MTSTADYIHDRQMADWLDKYEIGLAISRNTFTKKWEVRLYKRILHRYSDKEGSHLEEWEVSRFGEDLRSTWEQAKLAMQAKGFG